MYTTASRSRTWLPRSRRRAHELYLPQLLRHRFPPAAERALQMPQRVGELRMSFRRRYGTNLA
jgi:hypothetical protein